jgi:prevent-host-death family protein
VNHVLRRELRASDPDDRIVAIIMATRTVGVRDLKLHAPALVRRAASGESIVITRYGRPEAVLGPVRGAEQAGRAAAGGTNSARMDAWRNEQRAFERLLPRIVRRYRGRYVAVLGGRVVDTDQDHDALFERVWRKHGLRAFYIGRVGAAPAIVEMPGFEVE